MGFEFFQQNGEKEKFENLPEELRGKDLFPDKMEKLENNFSVLMDHIIISFDRRHTQEVADFLGISVINTDRKKIYTFNELKGVKKYGLL